MEEGSKAIPDGRKKERAWADIDPRTSMQCKKAKASVRKGRREVPPCETIDQ